MSVEPAPIPELPAPDPPPASHDAGHDAGLAGSIRELVSAVLHAAAKAGRLSAAGASEALETPAKALARRSVAGAAEHAGRVGDEPSLARALAKKPSGPILGGATAAALVTKVAKRVGPLRFVARRTPLWLAATLVPALHASITRGAEELRLVAAHLHHRARKDGVATDPDRLRRVAVQIVTGQPVDPDVEPRHAPLATAWLQRAVRATLPFSDGVRTRDPEGMAAAAAGVDPSNLQ